MSGDDNIQHWLAEVSKSALRPYLRVFPAMDVTPVDRRDQYVSVLAKFANISDVEAKQQLQAVVRFTLFVSLAV